MRNVKQWVLVTGLVCVAATITVAQDSGFSIDVEPTLYVPLRSSTDLFSIGGGADLTATIDFRAPAYAGGGIGYTFLPTPGTANLSLISAVASGGLRLGLTDFLALRFGLSAGAYVALYEDLVAVNPTLGARGALEVNLGDSFRIRAGAGYNYSVGSITLSPFSETALAEGLTVQIGASFSPGSSDGATRRSLLDIDRPVFHDVFPVFYQYYNDSPIGTVTITNRERQSIRNVTVSFFAIEFMDEPKRSDLVIDTMEPGESLEVPILALFSSRVLTITERTSVASRIMVEYQAGEDRLVAERTETLRILNRNNMTWDDDAKAAAFVTANDPTVLRFARNITAAIRSEGQIAVNENLRTAMAIFQALNLYGVDYRVDPDSSYVELSEDSAALDYLQFPQQTLDYRLGDCDDLSILYSALLESVGIRTAFITIPGHIYMAFALDMDEEEAEQTFRRSEDLIFMDRETWIPVEITLVREDFLSAWDNGAKEWRENVDEGADFIPVRTAWMTYPASGFASEAIPIAVPQTTEVLPVYTEVLGEFIDREIGPQVAELQSRIEATDGSPRLVNRLGTLYARYGLYEEAEEQFSAIVEREPRYLAALVNLGNIYYLREDLNRACEYFDRAREVRTDDPNVLINLARVHFDLEEYLPATERYREAELISPEVASQYAYIVNENRETARASAAQARRTVTWKEE
jgi:tetratricopeptide (TPR) repeat protein